jgi:hypothetical protein
MSSLVRTIQKRIAKAQGYTRQTSRVEIRGGQPVIIPLKRGQGDIIGPDGESTGSKQWPQVSHPTREVDVKDSARRGSRRGRMTAKEMARRAGKPLPKLVLKAPVYSAPTTKEDRKTAHKQRMKMRKLNRDVLRPIRAGLPMKRDDGMPFAMEGMPAFLNRHGQPHENAREIARRARRNGAAL